MTPKQTINRRFMDMERTTKLYMDYIDNNLESILARGYQQPDWYVDKPKFTIHQFVHATAKAISITTSDGCNIQPKGAPTRKNGRYVKAQPIDIGTIIDMQLVKAISEYVFYDSLNAGDKPTEFTPKHRKAVRKSVYDMYQKYKYC